MKDLYDTGYPTIGLWPSGRDWDLHTAYKLGSLLSPLDLPKAVRDRSLQSFQRELIKMSGRMVRHAGQLVSQLAAAVHRELFAAMPERLTRLHLAPH